MNDNKQSSSDKRSRSARLAILSVAKPHEFFDDPLEELMNEGVEPGHISSAPSPLHFYHHLYDDISCDKSILRTGCDDQFQKCREGIKKINYLVNKINYYKTLY